ncbi:MAG TPA: glycosyltransferase family 2 protein [Edaphobacter sp.]|nr:glycosyltransferase family 2 protein [Edaphobacter sp.]
MVSNTSSHIPSMTTPLSFVVVSPARNEAQFIELTLQSVVAQKIRPMRWVIVSDGSTDGTDEIVARYASQYSWIRLLRMGERQKRDFAGKVHAFNAGYAQMQDLDHDVVVSLDADISFDLEYFSFLLEKLQVDPTLGLVGTPFQETTGQVYDYRFVSIDHVSGACQVFRRECFQSIGGYLPVPGGSIDHIAVISARMKGWKTRTFTEKVCLHHRGVGTAQRGILASKFKLGIKDYAVGNHPLWELCRVGYQMTQRPRCLGALALGSGYISAVFRRNERPVSRELVKFHRQEQMQRLRRVFRLGTSRSIRIPNPSSDPQIGSGAPN